MKLRLLLFLIIYICKYSIIHAQQFRDVSYILQGNNDHIFNQEIDEMPLRVSAGMGVADINNDDYFDIVLTLGDHASFKVLVNQSGKSFEDQTQLYGMNNYNFRSSAPYFFNYNNDEYIDLIVGSVDGTPPILFKNVNGIRFEPVEIQSFDVLAGRNTITITSVDYNNDGHQDLFFSHWMEEFEENHFWKNLGNGNFEAVDNELEFYSPHDGLDFTHNAIFMDLNEDGYQDLLLCSDFGTSQVWVNDRGKKFVLFRSHTLLDENAMGSTVGDFDNDGDLDWFVTSIFDNDGVLEGNWGGTGNKLYVNEGAGKLTEETHFYGLEDASWGWGTSFADFNNDGYLDLIVVNGWPQGSDQFKNDQIKVFISDKGHFFNDLSHEYNIIDTLQGRGVSCIDFNNDGLLDILVSNYRGPAKLYQNFLQTENNYLSLSLLESDINSFGLGVKVTAYIGDKIITKINSNASNYVSQNPYHLHFGLGHNDLIDLLEIKWNDGSTSRYYNVKANQFLRIQKPLKGLYYDSRSYLYPNPATNKVSFILQNKLDRDSKILIINDQGKLIREIDDFYTFENTTYIDNIDVSLFPTGHYHLIYYTRKNSKKFNVSFLKI